MYGYIYLVQNLITGKGYIGQHKWSDITKWDNNYYGSGTLLKKAIEKYGTENFSRHVICTCESKKELDEKEIYWIKELNCIESNDWYNIAPGGDGGVGNGWKYSHYSGDQNPSKRPDVRKKISDANTGKLCHSGSQNGMYGKGELVSGEKNGMFGVHRYGSDNPCYGIKYTWYTNGEVNKRVNEGCIPPIGFYPGKVQRTKK